ncbi:hypothetical protein XENTR_v10006263 [Xenopus tropicalis]|nr:hypothetical protein XENTR_v10006263 [Xenopus tropicalis]
MNVSRHKPEHVTGEIIHIPTTSLDLNPDPVKSLLKHFKKSHVTGYLCHKEDVYILPAS